MAPPCIAGRCGDGLWRPGPSDCPRRAINSRAAIVTRAKCGAVIFDLDDTLFDRRRSLDRYIGDVAANAGMPRDSREACRRRFHELDDDGYADRATLFRELIASFPALGTPAALRQDYRANAWRQSEYMPGAVEILAWCRSKGLKTGVLTNGSSMVQRAKIESLALVPLVDAILIAEEEGVAKPDPAAFERAATQLGVALSQCVFVGDHPHFDVDGARRAGLSAIWARGRRRWPLELPEPRHIVDSLFDLQALIDPLTAAAS